MARCSRPISIGDGWLRRKKKKEKHGLSSPSRYGFPRLPSSPLPRAHHRRRSPPPRPGRPQRAPLAAVRLTSLAVRLRPLPPLPARPLQRRPPAPAGHRTACSQADAAGPAPLFKTLADLKDSCWRFLRPYTIRGTALGSTALVARALIGNPQSIDWRLVFKVFYGLVALICGNGYIVGIYQIYDI